MRYCISGFLLSLESIKWFGSERASPTKGRVMATSESDALKQSLANPFQHLRPLIAERRASII